jgi:hypothetical protein
MYKGQGLSVAVPYCDNIPEAQNVYGQVIRTPDVETTQPGHVAGWWLAKMVPYMENLFDDYEGWLGEEE